jgi:glucose/mannose transport system substrate-binding protein
MTGSIPARTDVNLAAEGFSDGQRNSAQNLRDAVGQDRVLLSLGHNMAQPNGMTAAMIDVLTEYVHDSAIPSAEGQKRLIAAVESAQ